MPKTKTHFPQVPVEIAEKAARAESDGEASVMDAIEEAKKKSSNGNASRSAEESEAAAKLAAGKLETRLAQFE